MMQIYAEDGFYHVYSRGANKQNVFIDTIDYHVFKMMLKKAKDKHNVTLFAYCLMPNHFHLLAKSEIQTLSKFMNGLVNSYARWFNNRYFRTGPVFGGRYKRKLIENDTYFLTVMRYIHQNPLKAGLCNEIQEYPESSYHEYLKKSGWDIIDINELLTHIELIDFIKINEQIMETNELALQGEVLGLW